MSEIEKFPPLPLETQLRQAYNHNPETDKKLSENNPFLSRGYIFLG
jgi:hypothetical protein